MTSLPDTPAQVQTPPRPRRPRARRPALERIVTAAQIDLTAGEVRRRFDWAVEYVGLDGKPCRIIDDLEGRCPR